MKTKILVLILIGCAAVAAYIFFRQSKSETLSGPATAGNAAEAPPAEVLIETIQSRPIDVTRELPGRTSAYRIAEIRPQVSGIITKRLFEEGSDVKAGQQLYQIDPRSYQAVLESASADLMKAQANARSVTAKSARYEELVKIGGVSKQEFDDIRASASQANADIAIAQARLSEAKINLEYTKVFSPIPGRIGKSLVTEGALATQNQAQALATVQQLDPIFVDVTQSSAELMALQRQASGQNMGGEMPVSLMVEGDNESSTQKGKLQFSDVSVDPTTGSVQIRILFSNPDHRLLPGMFVRAKIVQSSIPDAILVSQKAVSRNPDGSAAVMTIDAENKVVPKVVQLGEAIGDQWIVKDGLKTGDRVMTEGVMKAPPGSVVKPVEAKAAAATTTMDKAATASGSDDKKSDGQPVPSAPDDGMLTKPAPAETE